MPVIEEKLQEDVRMRGIPALVKRVIDNYQGNKRMLIQILLDLQSGFGWLPEEVLSEVSKQLKVPSTRVYHIVTFYKAFSLVPKARHAVKICMGTACQVRGAQQLLDKVSSVLNIEPGELTPDLRFSLDTVNCLGCCAMGPVVVMDEVYYPNSSLSELKTISETAR